MDTERNERLCSYDGIIHLFLQNVKRVAKKMMNFASFFQKNCKKGLTNRKTGCIIGDVKGNGVFESIVFFLKAAFSAIINTK